MAVYDKTLYVLLGHPLMLIVLVDRELQWYLGTRMRLRWLLLILILLTTTSPRGRRTTCICSTLVEMAMMGRLLYPLESCLLGLLDDRIDVWHHRHAVHHALRHAWHPGASVKKEHVGVHYRFPPFQIYILVSLTLSLSFH